MLSALAGAEVLATEHSDLRAELRRFVADADAAVIKEAAADSASELERAAARLPESDQSEALSAVADAFDLEQRSALALVDLSDQVTQAEAALKVGTGQGRVRHVKVAIQELDDPDQAVTRLLELERGATQALNASLDAIELELDPEADPSTSTSERLVELRSDLRGAPSASPALEGHLRSLRSRLSARLEELKAPPLVTGPAACGSNANGAVVVINLGAIACQEAIFVSENSSGTELGSGPPGWNCGLNATTIEGVDVDGASGYACVNQAGVRISIHDPNPTPVPVVPDDSGTGDDCPPGEDFIQGRCIVIETGGEEAGP
ncbi:MAG: hypothetical protein QOI31_1691 [Solirubrobacterales bacterium]|nr:hypothetical protein [Solirubrobacterales bacterium]